MEALLVDCFSFGGGVGLMASQPSPPNVPRQKQGLIKGSLTIDSLKKKKRAIKPVFCFGGVS